MLNSRFERFRHFSFDLDGTLVDSVALMEKAWSTVNIETGIEIPFVRYKQFIGLPFEKILACLGVKEGRSEIRKIYFEKTASLATSIKAYEGAVRLLRWLDSQPDIIVSIITSKPNDNALQILDNLELPYAVLVGGDDLTFGKPYADPFNRVVDYMGLSPEDRLNSIYFGDVLSDFVFSINARIHYCHCNYGFYGNLPKLVRNSYMSIDSLNEVLS